MPIISATELDEFVAKTDSLGGPGSKDARAFWGDFQYKPVVFVDDALDPYSEEYFNQQCALYKELSHREIRPQANELTPFEIENHIYAPNPYGVRDPSKFVLHFLRLGFVIERAQLPPTPNVLDMGAGWGLSSEFLATLGARVTAVDINPSFVELIRRRQALHKNDIKAIVGTFDDFEPDERFDAILFYECLHHAMKPWELIARAQRWLNSGGKIVFAGEPVNNNWWRHWGLRLDAESVYCIRKFGWFESGWSKDFIVQCFRRSGMSVDFIESSHPEVGAACVATKITMEDLLAPRQLRGFIDFDGWSIADDHITSMGDGEMTITQVEAVRDVTFDVMNYRPKAINISISNEGRVVRSLSAPPGKSTIRYKLERPITRLRFVSDTWIPSQEIGNADTRSISFCITGATFS